MSMKKRIKAAQKTIENMAIAMLYATEHYMTDKNVVEERVRLVTKFLKVGGQLKDRLETLPA